MIIFKYEDYEQEAKILPSTLDFPKNWHFDEDRTVASNPAVADDIVAEGDGSKILRFPAFDADAAVLIAAASTEGLSSGGLKRWIFGPGLLTNLALSSGNMVIKVMLLFCMFSELTSLSQKFSAIDKGPNLWGDKEASLVKSPFMPINPKKVKKLVLLYLRYIICMKI